MDEDAREVFSCVYEMDFKLSFMVFVKALHEPEPVGKEGDNVRIVVSESTYFVSGKFPVVFLEKADDKTYVLQGSNH